MNPRENRPADPFGSGMAAYPDIPFSRNRLLHWLIGVYAVLWAILAIAPLDRMQWLMENLLPVGAVVALACTYRKFRFSNVSYILIFVFLCIHTFAAHYTYQNTPVDVWIKAVMHTQRSYFDRFVHFFFGLLMAYPFREVLMRLAGLRGFWSYVLPAALVFAFSSLFEIIEMFVALAAGQAGANYIGLQGDIFDSQKDMGLGLAGAFVSMGILAWVYEASRKKRPSPAHS